MTPSRTGGAPVQRRTTFNSNDTTGNSGRGMSLDRSGKAASANPSPELKKWVPFQSSRINFPKVKCLSHCLVCWITLSCEWCCFMLQNYLLQFGGRRVVGNILAHGAGRPVSVPCIPVRLISPSLARRLHLINEMYKIMWRYAWLPCS